MIIMNAVRCFTMIVNKLAASSSRFQSVSGKIMNINIKFLNDQ